MSAADDPSTEQVLTVARLAAAHPDADEDALAALLRGAGFGAADADRAVILVPSAFARPMLRRLGVEQLPATYRLQDASGTWHERQLAEEPWFRVALIVAVATVTHGYATGGCTGPTASRAEFEALLELSPEINATGQALDRGLSLAGSAMHPLQVYRWRHEAAPPRWQFWRR